MQSLTPHPTQYVISEAGALEERWLNRIRMKKVLHWLDIPQRNVLSIKSESQFTGVCRTKAPQYLMDCCTRTSDVSSRQRLRSANSHQLMVPRHCRSTLGRRAFSFAGPMEWNSLPDSLHDPARSTDSFRSALMTHLFAALRDE